MNDRRKVTIVLEGQSDLVILKALLPEEYGKACSFVAAEGRSTLVSVARTHLIKHRQPIAVMLDTDTMEPTAILEIVRTTRYLMGSIAGNTAFDIVYCTPNVEMIFFNPDINFKRYFPACGKVYVLPFALNQPKQQLQALFDQGDGPHNLSEFLGQLSIDDIKTLRAKYPIQHVMNFISNNVDANVLAPQIS
jgi:hypothetical protein